MTKETSKEVAIQAALLLGNMEKIEKDLRAAQFLLVRMEFFMEYAKSVAASALAQRESDDEND